MQGLQWSVFLSVAMSWSAIGANQFIEPEPDVSVVNEPTEAQKVHEFFSLGRGSEISPLYHHIKAPGASFIKVHFSQFVLPDGITVVVQNAGGTETYRYSSTERDPITVDYSVDDDGITSFSAMSISGDEAIVTILGDVNRLDPSIHRFEIDAYMRGATPNDVDSSSDGLSSKFNIEDSDLETTCGVNERYDAICYRESDPAVYKRSKPVVLIITSRGKVCTGWRVGAQNRLLTVEHCVSSQEDLEGAEIWFNYRASSCGGTGTASEVKVTGDELLATDHTFDYSLFTVNEFSSVSQFGYLGLDVRNGPLGEGIFIPQHGLGQPRQVALESDMNPGGLCQIDDDDHYGYEAGSDIGYFCDTTTSSSGSPVISSTTGKVIALHHLGGCFNSGTKITKIWPQIAPHFSNVVPKADSAWDFEPSNQVPEADFDISCDALNCELNASPSNDPDGEIVEFSWSLSDGTQASGSALTHEFADSGDYDITLEVEDNEGATDYYQQTITVMARNQVPEARFSISCVQTSCSFDGGSSADPDGSITSWEWLLGDGSNASGDRIEHTYGDEGSYSVKLTVKDNDDASGTKTHTVSVNIPNQAPVASFSVSCEELDCSFDASDSSDSDGKVESYEWSLGDGKRASGREISHSYAAEGDFSVSLTVRDDENATDNKSEIINVASLSDGPVANFTYSCKGKVCTLEAEYSIESEIAQYSWDFDDGSTGEGSTVVHEFRRGGYYAVSLKVVERSQATATKTRGISIRSPKIKLNASKSSQTFKPMVTLTWTGAESETVIIYRDGEAISSTNNDGKFTDLDAGTDAKPANYVLCESDTARCSDQVLLAYF
ncbi:MAG: PKD domain-containing protein [Xanthomonadales bacterium]|nr:PKD domain-containing protein [Gammaproteobacteria bacterium]MBT8053923.1 PKD domain-containing protein [Gammaproteobacteria bacterium]NND58264.1 PKD domain-containing protein [Xanthomonadales bacterium]NNK52025.1 PKD domain-containing protein [Xanthomonadales bacterium]